MDSDVVPEPGDPHERAALMEAAAEALDEERESAWWRAGLEDLGGGAGSQQTWRGTGVVEA